MSWRCYDVRCCMQATASACLFSFASLFHFTFNTMFSASPRSSVEAFLCVTAYHERWSLFSVSPRSSVEAYFLRHRIAAAKLLCILLSHFCTFSRYLTVSTCFDLASRVIPGGNFALNMDFYKYLLQQRTVCAPGGNVSNSVSKSVSVTVLFRTHWVAGTGFWPAHRQALAVARQWRQNPVIVHYYCY